MEKEKKEEEKRNLEVSKIENFGNLKKKFQLILRNCKISLKKLYKTHAKKKFNVCFD